MVGGIYAQNRNGSVVGCSLEIYTDTPYPTLGIRYGNTVSCNDPSISGTAVTALADIRPTGATGLPGPYGVQLEQGGHQFVGGGQEYYQDSQYRRIADSQTEVVYAYVIADTTAGKWLTDFGGNASSINCSPTGTSHIVCEIISNPFAFIPDTNFVQSCVNVGSGACQQARDGAAQAQKTVDGAPATFSQGLQAARAAAGLDPDQDLLEADDLTDLSESRLEDPLPLDLTSSRSARPDANDIVTTYSRREGDFVRVVPLRYGSEDSFGYRHIKARRGFGPKTAKRIERAIAFGREERDLTREGETYDYLYNTNGDFGCTVKVVVQRRANKGIITMFSMRTNPPGGGGAFGYTASTTRNPCGD